LAAPLLGYVKKFCSIEVTEPTPTRACESQAGAANSNQHFFTQVASVLQAKQGVFAQNNHDKELRQMIRLSKNRTNWQRKQKEHYNPRDPHGFHLA
jgi:hypothetical protein